MIILIITYAVKCLRNLSVYAVHLANTALYNISDICSHLILVYPKGVCVVLLTYSELKFPVESVSDGFRTIWGTPVAKNAKIWRDCQNMLGQILKTSNMVTFWEP